MSHLKVEEEKLAKDRGKLLQNGGTTDCEEFRTRAEIWRQRHELAKHIAQRNSSLERIVGPGERLNTLKKELSETSPDEHKSAKSRAEEQLSRLDTELKEALKNHGSLQHELSELERKGDTGELRVREEMLKAKLQEEARKWSVAAIARRLLARATERYELERQPGVIRNASRFFEIITRKSYSKILAPPGETAFHVLDRHDHRRHMNQLSGGTREQLYFAVRLGLMREFSERQEPLPVVMDDVLVNFDPHRAEAAVPTLLELAKTHQVLLFTCHPETCELVARADPSVPAFKLEDAQVTVAPVRAE